MKGLLPAIVKAINCVSADVSMHAYYTILNFSCTKRCRDELCCNPSIISSLIKCMKRKRHSKNKIAALKVMKNLLADPCNFIHFILAVGPIKDIICITSVSASGDERKDDVHNDELQYIASDVLALIFHCIMSSAVIASNTQQLLAPNAARVMNVSFQVRGWNQWQ